MYRVEVVVRRRVGGSNSGGSFPVGAVVGGGAEGGDAVGAALPLPVPLLLCFALSHLEKVKYRAALKKLFPGCVTLGEKVAFCLPTAGRRTQFFQLNSHNLEKAF